MEDAAGLLNANFVDPGTRESVIVHNYRPIKGSRCEVDVAFTRARVAVQLDGCFWHGCPEHATRPITNGVWWANKLEATIVRDRLNDELLRSYGWTVLRFWEHETLDEIVAVVYEELATGSER